jgi:hypothetical protein
MSALWMRWLDFRRLRDVFWVVAEHDCALRAKDLNELAVSEGILVSEKGIPFKPTPIYHYRRTLERLELTRLNRRRYCIARDDPNVDTILSNKRKSQTLSVEERKALSTLVLQNKDCFDAFLSAFIGHEARPANIDDFIRTAKPVSININTEAAKRMEIRLHNMERDFQLSSSGENAVQAILWGLKAWCVDQLQFLDEVFSTGIGYVIYPRDIEIPPPSVVVERLVGLLDFKGEWAITRVEELILSAGTKWHIPAEAVREALRWFYERFPDYVAPISTSEQFVLSRVHPSQRKAVLNSYLRLPTGELVSHLRIHSRIAVIVRDKGVAQ